MAGVKGRSGAPRGNQNAKGNRGGTGRPPIYNPDYHPDMAYKAFLLPDMTHKKLAQLFGVVEDVIDQWKAKYFDFYSAIERGKAADVPVVHSLQKAACGYNKKTEKVFCDPKAKCPYCKGTGKQKDRVKGKIVTYICPDCNGRGQGIVIRVPTKTYYPPSVPAASMILMNRRGWKTTKSEEWKAPALESEDGDSIDVTKLSPETQLAIMRDLERARGDGNGEGGREGDDRVVSKPKRRSK